MFKIIQCFTCIFSSFRNDKIITRIIKSNRNKGNSFLKRKIVNELNTEGFSSSLIENEVAKIEFKSDEDIAKKEYEKLHKKLSRKYSGTELELKIKQKLYQKGLKYDI